MTSIIKNENFGGTHQITKKTLVYNSLGILNTISRPKTQYLDPKNAEIFFIDESAYNSTFAHDKFFINSVHERVLQASFCAGVKLAGARDR